MKVLIIHIFLLSISLYTKPQFKIIQENGGNEVGIGIPLKQGNILYVGNPYNDETENLNLKLYLLDINGNLIKSKHLNNDKYYETVRSVIETNNNEFLVCGDRRLKGATDRFFFVTKIDQDFNVLYDSTYGTELSNFKREEGRNLIELNNNRYLINYSSYSSGAFDNVFLMIDNNGKIVWKKNINQKFLSSYPSINYEDNIIKLTGFAREENDYMLAYIDLDSTGKIIHSAIFDKYETNACYVVGKKRYDFEKEKVFFSLMRDSCSGAFYDILISKIDNLDNITLNKKIELDKSYLIEDVINTFDGGYLMVGNIKEYLSDGYTLINRGLFFYKFDNHLDSVWNKEIIDNDYKYIDSYSFFNVANKFYYFCGNQSSNYIIGRLDLDGEVDNNFLKVKKNRLNKYQLKVNNYEIIINNYETVNLDIQIFNVNGQQINSKILLPNQTYRTTLYKGLYILKINQKENYKIEKIIVQ